MDRCETSPADKEDLSVTLCLGSNFGHRRENIEEALAWLSRQLTGFRESHIYETPAYGHVDGAPYFNAVAIGIVPLDSFTAAERLNFFEAQCKRYEFEHGRDAEARRNNNVPIDIDIVIAGKKILRPGDYCRSFFQIGYNALLSSE